MKTKILLLAGLAAAPLFFAGPAQAGDYCREYTKEVMIGGRYEVAYGRACLEPDGSWRTVSFDGPSHLRPEYVNFGSGPTYYEPRYYEPSPRVVYVQQRPRPVYTGIFFGFDDRHHHGKHKKWNRHDRWDRHDRDDHRGRGRGHGRD
jgi:hypothetical protein